MTKKFISTITCLCVIAACGTAFAQQGKIQSGPYKGPMGPMMAPEAPAAAPFYSNLVVDNCVPGQMYSTANGFFILGPNNCFAAGSTQWIAYPFVSAKAGTVRQVQLAITNDTGICTPTTSKFTVQIYDDLNCNGTPSNPLGAAVVATSAAAPPALALANFARAAVTLAAGTTYWVVVTTSIAATQMGTTAVWWEANANVQGFNLNDGNGWISAPLGGAGGFSVQ